MRVVQVYFCPALSAVATILAWGIVCSSSQPRLVIAAGTLIDGRGAVLHHTRIVIEGSRIVAIDPARSPVDIDLSTRTVMPGWIDTHVHLSWHFDERGRSVADAATPDEAARHSFENAAATLRAGFTTVQSLGAPIDGLVRDAIARGGAAGPRVLTSLRQISGTSGNADGLRALVRQVKGSGADAAKLFATPGLGGEPPQTMSDAQLRAACGEATMIGMRSAVHAVYDGGARAAVLAGCTSIEHGTYVSNGTLTLMAERGTWFDPTLLVWHNYIDNRTAFELTQESVQTIRQAVRPAADALRRARARGVRIVFGTDAVAGAHGRNAEEFVYRVQEAHEKPADAIISATSMAAESLGLGTRIGTIAAGYEADLVATDGNPLDDITAVRRVVFVMKGGTSYSRVSGRVEPATGVVSSSGVGMDPVTLVVVPGFLGGIVIALVFLRLQRPSLHRVDPFQSISTDVINAARIRVAGVGGLGLVAMAVVVAIAVPRIGLPLAAGLVLGALMAVVLIALRSRTGAMPSSGQQPGANTTLSIDAPAPTAGTDPGGAPKARAITPVST